MDIRVRQTETIDDVSLISMMKSAATEALDDTAKDCLKALEAEALDVFDRPTPWAQKAFASFRASEHQGVIDTEVFVKTAQADWLYEREIFGGDLVAGDPGTSKAGVAVPGPAASLNAFGGLERGTIAGAVSAGRAFFKDIPDGNVAVMERTLDGSIDLLATLVRDAHYDARFDFFGTVEATVSRQLPKHFADAMESRQQG